MKSFIKKINTYLIERYPNIWNTRLFWILGISLVLHILFFILGYVALSNPESLHRYQAKNVFFNSGAVFFSVILSILIIVIWSVYLFKNNAFKAFYPTKQKDLLIQYCCYFIAVFSATSFFLSYSIGLKTFINTTYPDKLMVQYIITANDTALFLSHSLNDYTINNKRYPNFFFDNYCETKKDFIDYKNTYYSTFEFDYQFYNIKATDYKDIHLRDNNTDGFIYKKHKDSITYTYYFKNEVITANLYIKTLKPSYFNYSETFYNNKDFDNYYKKNNKSLAATLEKTYDDYKNYTKEHYLRNKQNTELLQRNSVQEIKTLLTNYLKLSSVFKIDHNLTTDKWFKLIHNPKKFEVTNFIKNSKPPKHHYIHTKELKSSEQFVNSHKTEYYISSNDLKKSFNNIDNIKESTSFFDGIHVFTWLAFGVSLIVFMLRVTNLRTLLFSIVSTGIMILLITLIMFLIFYLFNANSANKEYISLYLCLFIGGIILATPWFLHTKFKKIIVGVCLNISLAGFLPFVFLIITIISMHQNSHYKKAYQKHEYDTLLECLGILWSPIFLIIGFIFIYFYSSTIKKWKALPEG